MVDWTWMFSGLGFSTIFAETTSDVAYLVVSEGLEHVWHAAFPVGWAFKSAVTRD